MMNINRRKNKIYRSPVSYIPTILNILFLIGIGLICLVPFLYVVSVSFTSPTALSSFGAKLWPSEWSLEAYKFLLMYPKKIIRSYGVTIFITVVGTALALMTTTSMGYALSKRTLPGRKIFMGYIMFAMMFGGGQIPTYLVVNTLFQGTVWSIICSGAFSIWNMILMRNFFMGLPPSLEESALLDGANEIQVLIKVVMPLSKPLLATIGLFCAVAFWSQWYGALLYIEDQNNWPIMMFLKTMLDSSNVGGSLMGGNQLGIVSTESMRMAVVVVCTLPILCVYPFLQKYFVKGVMVGSIKG